MTIMLGYLLVILVAASATATLCPDGSKCERGTCCVYNGTQSYACCPWTHGTCCSDHIHCCPEGRTCDVSHNRCLAGNVDYFALLKVPCGIEGLECSQGSKCCQLQDESHVCCPEGTQCGDTNCVRKDGAVLKPKETDELGSVVCPDLNQCPDRTTCCMMKSGDYGCCPLPNAVCCPDEETCCPSGYQCAGKGECIPTSDNEV